MQEKRTIIRKKIDLKSISYGIQHAFKLPLTTPLPLAADTLMLYTKKTSMASTLVFTY